jgi:hypothetical protein
MLQSEFRPRLDTHGAVQYSAAMSNDELAALCALADTVLMGRSESASSVISRLAVY